MTHNLGTRFLVKVKSIIKKVFKNYLKKFLECAKNVVG
jgi:transposase-like protein